MTCVVSFAAYPEADAQGGFASMVCFSLFLMTAAVLVTLVLNHMVYQAVQQMPIRRWCAPRSSVDTFPCVPWERETAYPDLCYQTTLLSTHRIFSSCGPRGMWSYGTCDYEENAAYSSVVIGDFSRWDKT